MILNYWWEIQIEYSTTQNTIYNYSWNSNEWTKYVKIILHKSIKINAKKNEKIRQSVPRKKKK